MPENCPLTPSKHEFEMAVLHDPGKIIEIPNPFLYSRAARKKFSFQYAEADHQPPAASQQPCVLSEACLSFVLVHFHPFLFSCFLLINLVPMCNVLKFSLIVRLGIGKKDFDQNFFCRQKIKSQKAKSQSQRVKTVQGQVWRTASGYCGCGVV